MKYLSGALLRITKLFSNYQHIFLPIKFQSIIVNGKRINYLITKTFISLLVYIRGVQLTLTLTLMSAHDFRSRSCERELYTPSLYMLFWLVTHFVTHSISTYLTVTFLSSTNIQILVVLVVCGSIESFIRLKVLSSEKSFVLSCIRRLHTLVHTRLLRTDWHHLKLADHEEMRRKINEACSSIQAILEAIIENCTVIYALISAIFTIALLCPWKGTAGLILSYLLFYLIYV
jgi:hypothetical protein